MRAGGRARVCFDQVVDSKKVFSVEGTENRK